MKHTLFVRVLHGVGHFLNQLGSPPRRQRSFAGHFREVAPFDQIHREVMLAALLADLMHRHDVRVF